MRLGETLGEGYHDIIISPSLYVLYRADALAHVLNRTRVHLQCSRTVSRRKKYQILRDTDTGRPSTTFREM